MTGPQTVEGWVLKLARERADLSPSELHVLSVLAMRHNRDFQAAHPKVDLMHRETHLSVRQIQRILNALADPQRKYGQVLHISYGPLPVESKNGHPVYGNVYRFVGFDEIPDAARPRRQLGGRPTAQGDDVVSTGPDDVVSTRADDTGDGGQMTLAQGSDDTGDVGQMTSANSPLYPGRNPASRRSEERLDDRNPALNPGRASTPNGIRNGTDSSSQTCGRCGDPFSRGQASIALKGGVVVCLPCGRGERPRAGPSPPLVDEPATSDREVPAGGKAPRERSS